MNLMTIDSTHCPTDLCNLGQIFPTDKSPLNNGNPCGNHRHAYTGIYNMIFGHLKNKEIRMAEIGILNNMSINCWRKFFEKATIFGLEFNEQLINNAKSQNLYNTVYNKIDVTDRNNVKSVFENIGEKFDIIIDDSTHNVEDQNNVIDIGIQYLKQGGYLIIEDIVKTNNISIIMETINKIKNQITFYTFIDANHEKMFSGDSNNDRLLLIIK